MNLDLSLKNKDDTVLLTDLKHLVSQERQLLTKLLAYFQEVETRKLYLVRGYSSLFAFLTGDEMGYSESAAYRRIQAMRLLREVPEVEEKIESGKMSLSVVSQVQGFIKKQDQKRRDQKMPQLKQEEKLALVLRLEGTSARTCEKKLAQMDPETALPKEMTKVLNMDKTLIQFVADGALMDKIERLMDLLSHQNPEGSYEQLFSKLADMALAKVDPEKRQERRLKKPSPLPTSEVKPGSRHIPNGTRDKVWLRDQGKCQYRDKETGRVCGSRYSTQLDHRYPYSLGGEHSERNLQLRCRSHNLFHAKEILGPYSP